MKRQIKIGVGDAISTAKGFVDAWKRAEQGDKVVRYRCQILTGCCPNHSLVSV